MQAERPCLNIATGQWSAAPHLLGYGGEQMKVLQIGSIIIAITITAAFPIGKNPSAEPNVAAEAEANPETPKSLAPSVETNHSPGNELSALSEEKTISHSPETSHSKSENYPTDSTRNSSGLSYLAFYPYGELPPARKPADVVLESLSSVPIGTPLEEIKRASDAFGLDFGFMRTVAKIEF